MYYKSVFLLLFLASTVVAQDRMQVAQETVTSSHETTIKGNSVPYKATTGTQPVWNDSGKVIAAIHFTYYERTDVKEKSTRPLVISFNGGPGSGSVWMHLAYTGPKILKIDEEGFPIQPYGVKSNPNSLLDVADIVYVNPVNTGYSRIIDPETDRKVFFGVNADIEYLAEWINTFVTRVNRWESPKYLIGESYGTTRVSGLALELQSSQWMYLNGVILVSPTELGIDVGGSGRREGPLGAALRVPYFTAAAWYHKKLPPALQARDLLDILSESEEFSLNTLLPSLAKGGFVDDAERMAMAEKMAMYSGISSRAVLEYNLDVPTRFYWKELLRDEGFTIGRLDSRYKGLDRTVGGDSPDTNAELDAWEHAFAPAINYYYRNDLNYKTDIKYNLFGPVHPWDNQENTTGEDLRQAMAQNPFLHVMVQSGYYDGATKYFDAKYSMWQLDPSGRMKDRLSFKGYRSGHMMYLRNEDLIKANEDLREFIKTSTPAPNQPAKY